MKPRTRLLAELVAAANALDDARDALTRAYVMLRPGGATALYTTLVHAEVKRARDEAYDGVLGDAIEAAVTAAGRLPV